MASPLSSTFGVKLNPVRRTRTLFGIKAERQTVTVTHNLSSVQPSQTLLVRFPTLSRDQVVVPGTAHLLFDTTITSMDANARFVDNLGRAVVKKLSVRMQGREVQSTDDKGIFDCYRDLWLPPERRASLAIQGVDDKPTKNLTKLRSGADDAVAAGSGAAQFAALGITHAILLTSKFLPKGRPSTRPFLVTVWNLK